MVKKIVWVSILVTLSCLFLLQGSITSCTKKKLETVIETKHDTLRILEQDTALTATILTANSWKIREIRALVSGSNYIYYSRGGSGNTQSYDNEYITFNANNTGTYVDNSGLQTTFTWNFTDASNTKLVWVWNAIPSPITMTWENIYYEDASLRYTEYFTQNGNKILTSATRIVR
jgi:hypothetical protein